MKPFRRHLLRHIIAFMFIWQTPPHLPAQAPEVGQKLAEMQASYDTAYEAEVGGKHAQAVKDLDGKYLAALDRARAAATQSGDLDAALALRDEKARLAAGQPLPVDDTQAAQALLPLRQTYRGALAGINAARATQAAPLQARYLQALEALQAQLTQAGELDGALAVKQARESFQKQTQQPPASPASDPALGKAPPAAIAAHAGQPKDRPFVNSLGMSLVPVPGTTVLFCIHETRRRDYAAYAKENPGTNASWKGRTMDGYIIPDPADEHPVRSVSWDDAKAFCEWLSKKEGKTYRLPTDREWSIAAGIGDHEKWKPGLTPKTLGEESTYLYPWGNRFPPPAGAGNYGDESRKAKAPREGETFLEGYDDGFPSTAPVMSFAPNAFGLFDMSGNVWEWVEDWYSEEKDRRVIRGASWHNHRGEHLRLTKRASPPCQTTATPLTASASY